MENVTVIGGQEIERVAEYLTEAFGDLKKWSWVATLHDTLAECLIDAVFSVRARHSDVERAIDRWRDLILAEGVPAITAADCAKAFAGISSSAAAIALPDNKIAGRKKRLIVADAAAALDQCGITTLADFRNRLWDDLPRLREAWLGVFGLGHASWCHLRLVADAMVVDPSPELRRKLARLIVDGSAVRIAAVSVETAMQILLEVADYLGVAPLVVEYALAVSPQIPVSRESAEASTIDIHAKVGAAH